MRKKALIIANQDMLLAGVSKDIEHIKTFLTGISGGAWESNEIEVLVNPSLGNLRFQIALDKCLRYDYMMVFFTGHGGHKREETYVQINNKRELIAQSELENLCSKQINIYDCCRSEIEDVYESRAALSIEKFDSASSYNLSREEAKRLYERQIEKAKPQQLILYSCSLNEYSQDESYGALYLTNLLKEANVFENAEYHQRRFKLALECHINASKRVTKENRDRENPQTPDYKATRFPQIDDHLVLSINPKKYIYG